MSLAQEENRSGGLIYDQAKYHFLGQFPSILPIEQAYVHIGMFFGWMLENELYSEIFEDEEAAQVYRFRRREISAGLLSELWDGYLGEDLFNQEGNQFSKYYYQSRLYRKDYEEVLAKGLSSIYHVLDTWENYEKIAARISERYQVWKDNPDMPPPEIAESEFSIMKEESPKHLLEEDDLDHDWSNLKDYTTEDETSDLFDYDRGIIQEEIISEQENISIDNATENQDVFSEETNEAVMENEIKIIEEQTATQVTNETPEITPDPTQEREESTPPKDESTDLA